MNGGIREKDLPEEFATRDYQVLLVADKYQTGFDQPLLHNALLHTMYVVDIHPALKRRGFLRLTT